MKARVGQSRLHTPNLARDMLGVKALGFLTSHCRIPQVEEDTEPRRSEPNRGPRGEVTRQGAVPWEARGEAREEPGRGRGVALASRG